MFENEVKKSLIQVKQPTQPVLSPTSPLSSSPSFGQIESNTVIDLISTLNHIYPDYDFRNTESKDFTKMRLEHALNSINLSLREIHSTDDRAKLWSLIDLEMDIKSCTVYEYTPDPESDPIDKSGRLWSWNYFFVNKKLKKVMYFSCYSKCKEFLKYRAEAISDSDSDPES